MTKLFQLYDRHGRLDAPEESTIATIGVFDGVHCGHKALLRQLTSFNPQLSTMVVTLTAHPSFILGRRNSEYWLDDPQEHLHLLFDAGAEYVAVMPFTREVAQLTACETAQILYKQLNMRGLLLGYDSRFGSKQDDDFDRLPQLASELGFSFTHGTPFLLDGQPVSSSRIRNSLAEGLVEDTATLLGRHYTLSGTVLHGRGMGHTLGFPTANIDLSQTRKMLPKEGVYAVILRNEDLGIRNCGMANLGIIPTFGIDKPTLEVHLLDFRGNLYGQHVTIEFIHRMRDIIHFGSAEALQNQLQKDLEQARLWS